jgi:hypothetical protein
VNNTRLKIGIGIILVGLVFLLVQEMIIFFELVANPFGSVARDPIGALIALVGFLFIIGHITGAIAFNKGRDYSSFFLLGFFFGPFGLFISLLLGEKSTQKVEIVNPDRLQGDTKKCKFCAEEIKIDAIFCKHCRNNLN